MSGHEISLDYMAFICGVAAKGGGARVRHPENDGWITALPCGGYRFDVDPALGRGAVSWRCLAPDFFLGLENLHLKRSLTVAFPGGADRDYTSIALQLRLPAQMTVAGIPLTAFSKSEMPILGFRSRSIAADTDLVYPDGSSHQSVCFLLTGTDAPDEFLEVARLERTLRDEFEVEGFRGRIDESDFSMSRVVQQMLCNPFSDSVYEAYIRAKAVELLCLLSTLEKGRQDDEQSVVVRRVCALIDEGLDVPLSLDCLADAARVSRRSLVRWFKVKTGLTVGEYQRQRRLEAAAELLAMSSTPVADIALSLGFSDAASFYRAFRAQYGVPPDQYRRASLV